MIISLRTQHLRRESRRTLAESIRLAHIAAKTNIRKEANSAPRRPLIRPVLTTKTSP